MADFQQCLSQGLLGYLCDPSCSAVRCLDFESAQHLIFYKYNYYGMLIGICAGKVRVLK